MCIRKRFPERPLKSLALSPLPAPLLPTGEAAQERVKPGTAAFLVAGRLVLVFVLFVFPQLSVIPWPFLDTDFWACPFNRSWKTDGPGGGKRSHLSKPTSLCSRELPGPGQRTSVPCASRAADRAAGDGARSRGRSCLGLETARDYPGVE